MRSENRSDKVSQPPCVGVYEQNADVAQRGSHCFWCVMTGNQILLIPLNNPSSKKRPSMSQTYKGVSFSFFYRFLKLKHEISIKKVLSPYVVVLFFLLCDIDRT